MNYERLNRNWLDQIVRLWNREIGKDFPMRTKLFIQNSFEDVNVLQSGSLLAINDANILVGFVIAKKYSESISSLNPETGWIQVLLVKTENRKKGIGTFLLNQAERALKENGVRKILLGKDVWHYFPGIPESYTSVRRWFVSKNYHFDGTEYDLLTDGSSAQVPVVTGAELKLLDQPEEKQLLLDFLHHCFPGRWEYEAIKYFDRGGIGREFVILKKRNKVIGFCRVNDPQSEQIAQNVYWSPLFPDGLGGIGPLGIDSSERGKGYGIAIVQAGQAVLNSRGLKHIVIDWTQLLDFYKKVDACPWKLYATYSKKVDPE